MRHPATLILDTRYSHHFVGFIPAFLDLDDPRPSKERLADRYGYGVLTPQKGFTAPDGTPELHYPGDPPFKPIAEIIGSGPYRFLKDEHVSGARAVFERFADYQPRPSGPVGSRDTQATRCPSRAKTQPTFNSLPPIPASKLRA